MRLLTLTGPGGVGKTRVAVEVTTLAQKDFADGAYFLQLASAQDAAFVQSALSRGMARSSPRRERLKLYQRTRRSSMAQSIEARAYRVTAFYPACQALLTRDHCISYTCKREIFAMRLA